MENIEVILEESESDLIKVICCGIFIKNMDDFAQINEMYRLYFIEPYPAQATVLSEDVLVEIDVITVL